METKKCAFIFLAVFLFLGQALCAQEAGYFVDYSEGNPKFIQRLEWDSEDYVLHYEVLIFVNDNGYREYLKDTTEENLLLVSLPPGEYRYNVTPYDLLGARGETSEWKEFTVLIAYQPTIESFTPEVFFLDKNRERILQITGTNFFEESSIYLLGGMDQKLLPENVSILNNRRATLTFDDMALINGSYVVYVENPGGLNAQLGTFNISYGKPLDYLVKLSWAPVIPLFGYLSDILGPSIIPGGLSFSFEAISSVRGNFNGGLELSASVLFLDPVSFVSDPFESSQPDYMYDDYYSPDDASGTYLASFDINIALQRRFNRRRMAFTFRFGVGAAFISNNYASLKQNDFIFELNLGADFLVRLYRDLCFEVGVDLNNHITPYLSTVLRPKLGIVWQF